MWRRASTADALCPRINIKLPPTPSWVGLQNSEELRAGGSHLQGDVWTWNGGRPSTFECETVLVGKSHPAQAEACSRRPMGVGRVEEVVDSETLGARVFMFFDLYFLPILWGIREPECACLHY
jgi:hypothetical protein